MSDAKTMFESFFQSPFSAFATPIDAEQIEKMSAEMRRMQDAGVEQFRKACDDMMALNRAQMDYALTINRAFVDMTTQMMTDSVKRATEASASKAA